MLKTLSLAAGALALFALTAPANAFDAGTVHASSTINYADLDVNAPAGAKTLLRRIKSAARSVCGPSWPEIRDLAGQQAYRACMDEAMERAVADTRSVLVSDFYHGKHTINVAGRN